MEVMVITIFILVFALVFIGAFLQGISGIGTGLVVVAVLPLFMTVKETTLIVLIILIFGGITVVLKYYRYIEWNKIIEFLIYVLMGRIIAFYILTTFGDLDWIKIWLGIFLLLIVLYQLLLPKIIKKKNTENQPQRYMIIIIGLSAGVIGGIFGIGGIFLATYFLMIYPTKKYSYMVSVQISAIISSVFSITLHAVNGDFEFTLIPYVIVGIIAVILGTLAGLRKLDQVNPKFIKKILLILIALASLNLIFFS